MNSLDFSMGFLEPLYLSPPRLLGNFESLQLHQNAPKNFKDSFQKAKVPKKYSGVVVPSKLKPSCFLSTKKNVVKTWWMIQGVKCPDKRNYRVRK